MTAAPQTAPTASLPPDATTAAPVERGAAFSFTHPAGASCSPLDGATDALPGKHSQAVVTNFEPRAFNAALQTYRGHHIDGAEDVVAASYVADGASGDISKRGNANAARF